VAIEFRLLGAVEVRIDGRVVDIGHARQVCVLASLVVSANNAVPVDQLTERAWGEPPPQRARDTLHSYISRLRKTLYGTGVTLDLHPSGYVLAVDPVAIDLVAFRALVAGSARTGNDESAAELLERALALWRGPALGILDTPWLNAERDTLHAERLAAQLDHYDVALRLGRHGDVVGALADAVAQHPWDERIAGQYMLALYRCGRPADALAAYRQVRARLAEELGVDPSPPLQLLHRQILGADPALAAPGPARHAGRTDGAITGPVPRQLPGSSSAFTGRKEELAALDRAVGGPGAGTAVALVTGGGGMGKTWLALRWADINAALFPDGQLYANLRGFDPTGDPVDPAVVLRGFLDALGIEPAKVPVDPDAQTALYRTLLAGKRVLVMLDNARDTATVLPLLPGSAACAVVVTSRRQLNALVVSHGARTVTVGVLPEHDARDVLTRALARPITDEDESALTAMLDHCAGLPLAIGIAAARAATQPDIALSVLAEDLRAAKTRLDALDAGELSVNLRAVLAASVNGLTERALSLFALLGLTHGPDIALPAVASLAGRPVAGTRAVLGELATAHLVSEPSPGRYRMHDLVRLYAIELADRDAAAADEARLRLLDHYLHNAHGAAMLLSPHREPLALAPVRPGVVTVPLADLDAAMAWFAAEHPVLLATIRFAAESGYDAHACTLPWTLATYFDRRGHWRDWVAAQHTAVAAARRLGDWSAQAGAQRLLANAYSNLRTYDDALSHLKAALDLFDKHDDDAGRAHTHFDIALLYDRQARPADALPHAVLSRTFYRATGNQLGEAIALNAIGWYHCELGEYAEALEQCGQALAITRAAGSRYGEANTLDSIGYAHHHLGAYRDAIGAYRDAIEIFRQIGDSHAEAITLDHLADSLDSVGERAEARDVWRTALVLLEALDHPDAENVRDKLR
jgi:DNA-binding SARP family transcriptional activator/tetratricopeptide (TPR) repeat protein